MGWIAYVLAWLAAAIFWALASGSSARMSPLATLPYGLLTMGVAGAMGVVVWRCTGRVPWNWRAPRFYLVHLAAVCLYSAIYTSTMIWPDLAMGRYEEGLQGLRTSPVLVWSLLMGSWLYLIVAGLSYAIRAHRRLRAEEHAAAEARLLAQQAQLAALRAQINPHFLFNALHSVGALITIDPARADEALECLGDLLRYALGSEEEIAFANEWAFTQNYLGFEQLRLGERLAADVEVDAAAMPLLVPPLLLQPIVENAVRHGIADRAEGGRIQVRASVRGDQLVLQVSDDGRGAATEATEGVGLGSVRRRLAALYDGRATLTAASSASGFDVTIVIPAKRAEDRTAA